MANQQWTDPGVLEAHLQQAIALELWTIPLYLTASASIKNKEQNVIPDTTPPEHVYDLIQSVLVQEMFHLTLACNVANAMGVTPKLVAPSYTTEMVTLKKQPPASGNFLGNLSHAIDTMLAVEKPDTTHQQLPTAPQDSYDSIGDFYHALAYGINEVWSATPGDYPKNSKRQKAAFSAKYAEMKSTVSDQPATTVHSLQDALQAIKAIVDEGEGYRQDGSVVPKIPEEFQPGQGQLYEREDVTPHYERFMTVQKNIDGVQVYDGTEGGAPQAQQVLTAFYSALLIELNESFAADVDSINLRGMEQVGQQAEKVWQAGGIPLFHYSESAGQEQLKEWAKIPLELHVCQGLNACAGHGVNGSGSGPGDGNCATVIHGCQFTNACRGQGACGSKGGTGSEWAPGANLCAAQGGCKSPISTKQCLPADSAYPNQKTWEVARTLFENRMKTQGKTVANGKVAPRPAPNALRQATNPTAACDGG